MAAFELESSDYCGPAGPADYYAVLFGLNRYNQATKFAPTHVMSHILPPEQMLQIGLRRLDADQLGRIGAAVIYKFCKRATHGHVPSVERVGVFINAESDTKLLETKSGIASPVHNGFKRTHLAIAGAVINNTADIPITDADRALTNTPKLVRTDLEVTPLQPISALVYGSEVIKPFVQIAG